jgi:protein O-mannosyl-transferase
MTLQQRHYPLVVLAAAVGLYALSLGNGFAYDDHVIIRLDERVRELAHIHRLLTEPYWRDAGMGLYRPLASLSYALDWQIVGDSAAWFHAVNVLWNAAVCVLVYLILAQLGPAPAALAGALVFTAHPLHVETVANVVGRAEAMAAFFVFAAMLVWLRTAGGTRLSPARMSAVAGLYGLALLSKESAVMLPALLALIDAGRGILTPANAGDWLRRHAAAFAVMALVAAGYLVGRMAVLGEVGPGIVDPALDVTDSAGERVLTALQAWPFIIRLLFYPRVLLSDYGPQIIMPATSWNALNLSGAFILTALVAGGVAAWYRGHGRFALVLLFLPVALLPVSNLIIPIGVIVAERALYLPSFALAAATALAFATLPAARRTQQLATVALGLVLFLFGARTLMRIPEWKSTATVFEALRRDRPDSFRAKWHEARVAVMENRPQHAVTLYAEALNMWPYRRRVVVEAANYGARAGDLPFAQQVAEHGLRRWPDDVDLLRLRAGLALDAGDTAAARPFVERGLQTAPRDSVLLLMQRHLSGGP